MEPLIIKLKHIAARLLNKEDMKVALHSSDTPLLIKTENFMKQLFIFFKCE